MSSYRDVVIETYRGRNTTSSGGVRARPLPGQGFDVEMNVECSSKMRKGYPVGTKFLIQAKLTSKLGGPDFLYSHYNSAFSVLSDKEAEDFIGGV